MKKQLNRIFAVVLSIAILASTLIIGGAVTAPVTVADTTADAIDLDLGETYTFSFDNVIEYTANTTPATDAEGNVFYPNRSADKAATAKQTTITYGEEEISALELSASGNMMYIPTDENGQPLTIEPNSTYRVQVESYALALGRYKQLFFGGGLYEANKPAYSDGGDKTFPDSIAHDRASYDMTALYPAYRTGAAQYAGEVSAVYFPEYRQRSDTLYFSTGDYDAEKGTFRLVASDGATYAFSNYFGVLFNAGKVSLDEYTGPSVVYIDSIAVTKTVGMDIGESFTFDFNEDETKEYPRNSSRTTVDGSSEVDGEGNTLYPLHIASDTAGDTAEKRANARAAYEEITVTTDSKGNTETLGTLKIANRYPADGNYIPTKNGLPFVIEPNTTYEVKVEGYTQYAQRSYGVYFGGGILNADQSYYTLRDIYHESDKTKRYFYTDGMQNGKADTSIPATRLMYCTSIGLSSTKGNYYTSDTVNNLLRRYEDFDKTGKNPGQYYNGTLSFTTGNFAETFSDEKDTLGTNTYKTTLSNNAATDPTIMNVTVGAYFGLFWDGYDVTGWYEDAETGTRVQNTLAQPVTHYIDYITITKVAQTATVTYDANGGTFADGVTTQTKITETVGESITAETPVNADENLAFAGWSLNANSNITVKGVDASLHRKTLYAVWGTPVNVTFDANGGTFDDGTDSQTLTKYVGLPMSCPTPSSAEGTFLGWATSAVATEAEAISEFVTADMANTTYYAVWSRSPHPANGDYDGFTRTVEFLNGTYDINSSNSFYNANAKFDGYYFEVIDDPDEEGDGILHYYNNIGSSVTYNANWSITPTHNGVSTGEVTADNNILSANSTYKITARVYIKDTGGYAADFTAFLGSRTGSSSNTVGSGTSKVVRYKDRINMVEDLTETDGFVDVVGYYSTPAQYEKDEDGYLCNRLYVGFRSAAVGYHLEYYLDSLTIEKVTNTNLYVMENGSYVLKDTLEGVPGTELTIPKYYSVENYSASDATGSETRANYNGNWYADEACTEKPVMKYGNFDVDLYCDSPATEVDPVRLDNQEMFVGFDTYTQYTNGFSVPALKLGCASDKLSLSDKEANSGSVSLKADISADDTLAFELKNDYTLDVMAGKTYRVDFVYKADTDAKLGIGLAQGSAANGVTVKNTVALPAADDWTAASVVFTADGAVESSVLAAQLTADAEGVVYIDTMIVSSATEAVGVLAETTENGEALRFMLTYDSVDEDTVYIAGKEYTVTEHGVFIKSKEVETELNLENKDAAGVFHFAQTDMANNWSQNPVSGDTVYSAYLEGFETDDDYKVSVRGYVTLNDGTVYYTDTLTASVTDIPEAGDIIPETADLSNYYVYLPEGTTLPADRAYTATTYNEVFVESSALSDNTLTEGAYVRFSAMPDFDAISVPDELKYLVHSGTKEQLYFGVDAQLVTQQLNSVGQDKVNYIFVTDTHFSESTTSNLGKSIINQMTLITKMANENENIDFVVVGGDITTGMYDTKADHIKYTQMALDPLRNCTKPVFVLMGNHDDNSYTTDNYADKIMTDLDWQNEIINRYTNAHELNKSTITVTQDTKRANSKYFYYDLEGKNTRVIALDPIDYQAKYDKDGNVLGDGDDDDLLLDGMPVKDATKTTDRAKYYSGYTYWGYSPDQLRWLAQDALDTDKEVIFISHMGIDMMTNSYETTVQFGNELRDIIIAYQNKTAYSAELTSVWGDTVKFEADFAKSEGKIISYQFGHQHLELTIYDYDVDLWQISTPSSRGVDNSIQSLEKLQTSSVNVKTLPWRVYTREYSGETEASFNVMSVSSDAVYRMTVGPGKNEKLIYPN